MRRSKKAQDRREAQARHDAFCAKLAKSDALDMKKALARFREGPATEGQISSILGEPKTPRFVEYDNRAERAILKLRELDRLVHVGWFGGTYQWALA